MTRSELTALVGATFATAVVVGLLAREVARIRGHDRRAARIGIMTMPFLLGFVGMVVVRFLALL